MDNLRNKPIKRNRSCNVHLRFTEKELNAFDKAFKKSGYKTMTDFVLALIDNASFNYVDGLGDILKEMSAEGNNLNQLTRNVNAGFYDNETLNECLNNLAALYEEAYSVIEKGAKF